MDITANYNDYLSEPKRIGFMEEFPVSKTLKTETYKSSCRNWPVSFTVSHCEVTFGKNNEYKCFAVVTSEVSISSRLPLSGFGSYCHHDEADTMEQAVVDFCKKNNLYIARKSCSWPFAKAIVSDIVKETKKEKIKDERQFRNYKGHFRV